MSECRGEIRQRRDRGEELRQRRDGGELEIRSALT